MNHIESQESTSSNDDTNLISELLNTAEAMQHQSPSMATTTAGEGGIVKNQLQQKCEQNQNSNEISANCYEASKQKIDMEIPQNNSGIGFLNGGQYTDTEDFNKMHNIRHVHIPYILNGELYQIQTQDGENVTVKCCHCPPDRVYRGSVRSTGNFHMHIKRRHPDLLEKLHDMKVTALLERRDRLMRNRKITHRHNRNRAHNPMATQSNDLCSFKNEDKPELLPASDSQMESAPELSLMHTHKLKIKAVFQRHQMQQREAAEMRNWNNADYVVMPIDKLPTNEESEQPINYSLKTGQHTEIQTNLNPNASNTQQQQQENRKEDTNLTTFNSFPNFTNQPTTLTATPNLNNNNNSSQQNDYICENNHRNFSTPSISLSCPSIMSTYSSNHQYELDTNRSYNSLPLHLNNLSIIKPEHLSLSLNNDTEAIDLTIHTDSGIFSNSDDSAGSLQHNDSQNSITMNRSGDNSKTNTSNITANEVERNGDNVNGNSSNNTKWQELLMQVENSLRDIQREMNVRNQIESNRMFLDIAKFKFLNPGFQFNW